MYDTVSKQRAVLTGSCCCVGAASQATPASDLYSLGATLLYLVSGQPPGAFPQKRMRIDYK